MKKQAGKPMEPLYEMLAEYNNSDYYPFHMPGHKRNMKQYPQKEWYAMDITEIEGFDNLHHPEGVLDKAQKRAAEFYDSEETFFLINGSTCGILSAISASVSMGGRILLARNCHRAAYNAVLLRQIEVTYLYPDILEAFSVYGGIAPEDIEKALCGQPDIEAVMITSPTMEGVVSDVDKIAEICHHYGKVLIVDEAHGAHFGMDSEFPKNAIAGGADIVIHSVHKTLPSLTQTALLHVNGSLADKSSIKRYLAIYQSSSPSYLLLGSIDNCIRIMQEQAGTLFSEFKKNLNAFRKLIKPCKWIKVMDEAVIGKNQVKDFDSGKMVISVKYTSMTGQELYDMLLERFHLQMEMAAVDYVLAIVTVMDTKAGFERLAEALLSIDKEIQGAETKPEINTQILKAPKQTVFSIYEADIREKKPVTIAESMGSISGEFVYLYPPGIPLLVPGEIITENIRNQIMAYKKQGLSVQGPADLRVEKISIII